MLSRQKLPYIEKDILSKNLSERGAYTIKITSHDTDIVLVASGSELELALKVQENLKRIKNRF